ncbi:MAG: GNAT family N-acetyltransferase [Actinomycetota bacterium]
MTDQWQLRTSTAAEAREVAELVTSAFLGDPDDESLAAYELVHEPERTHVVAADGRLVATGGVLTREMSVPGGTVPVAHVTDVAVAPTHRRRGLLSRIMDAQLEEISRLGSEPLAALWASEGSIYGRFGYGPAARHVWYSIPTRETALPGTAPPGRLRQVRPGEALEPLADVYDRVRVERPGLSGRPGNWWKHLTADPKAQRRGRSALRAVLYEDGGTQGYALWRVKASWGDTGPDGEVDVTEVVAATADAYAALWRFLLSIDLTRTVKYPGATVDEPLPHLLTDPQAMRATLSPSVWIRVVDLPGALAARRYAMPVDVVVQVSDTLLPRNAGRWRVVGDRSSAKCERTDADPDLGLDIRDLGAAYLGGTSLVSLAATGRVVEHRPGALVEASTAFGWHRAPTTFEVF